MALDPPLEHRPARGGLTAAGAGPQAVWTDGTRLVVADTLNARVLIWDDIAGLPEGAAGTPADWVLGQASPTAQLAPGPSVGIPHPSGVAVFGAQIFVSDTTSSRVMGWNAWPTTDGPPANTCLGSVDPNLSWGCNLGGCAPSPIGLCQPAGLAVAPGGLWVADSGNGRVLWFATQ